MDRIMAISLIGLSVGVFGTGMGGLIAFFIKSSSQKYLGFILGISSGLMLSIVCFDLLPEAFELGELYIGILGITIGVIIIIMLDSVTSITPKKYYKGNNKNFVKTGMLLGIGVALHNFPEGLAIGSSFMATKELGMGISIVIALHNMPEGISMATPMSIGGMPRIKALVYTILAGIPMGIGAFLGAVIGEISQNFIAFCLAFAGGTMLYITCGELIPKSQSLKSGKVSSYGLMIGFILGIMIAKKF